MSPASALAPIFEAAQAATLEVTGSLGVTSTPGPSWVPHVTLSYSTRQRRAAPIIAALGKELPAGEVTIDKLSLVIQHGPALSWGLAFHRDCLSGSIRRLATESTAELTHHMRHVRISRGQAEGWQDCDRDRRGVHGLDRSDAPRRL
jgi:hypothetical protein